MKNNEPFKKKAEVLVIGGLLFGSLWMGVFIDETEDMATRINNNPHTLTTVKNSHEISYSFNVDTEKQLISFTPRSCNLPKDSIIESIGKNYLGTLYTVKVPKSDIKNKCAEGTLNVIAQPLNMMRSASVDRDWEESVSVEKYKSSYHEVFAVDDKTILALYKKELSK